jgi:8-oxo-dGTP diphosphatase
MEVCCALVLKESKILAVQRGPESRHPLKWEFPGGKINPSETPEQAVVRELEEELMIQIAVVKQLSTIEYAYGEGKPFCLIPLAVCILSGDIHLTEHVAQRWLAFDELLTVDWLEADRELILKNQEELKFILQGRFE